MCVSCLFLLCDVILRALLCLGGGVRRLGDRDRGMRELRRMGMEKNGRERGEGRDKQRETKNYIAVCKNQLKPVKQREMGV